jgi:hypothetical protein
MAAWKFWAVAGGALALFAVLLVFALALSTPDGIR